MRQCAACSVHINIGDIVSCTRCQGHYHYKCLGMTKDYHKANIQELDLKWVCPGCKNVTRRPTRNDDTPVRSQQTHIIPDDLEMSITTQIENDISILGNTATADEPVHTTETKTSSPTLEEISVLLDQKLAKNSQLFLIQISDIKATIQKEIKAAVTKLNEDITIHKNIVNIHQEKIHTDIERLNNKIQYLEKENNKLIKQIEDFNTHLVNKPSEDRKKKLIIYGMQEYHRETEKELEDRLQRAFYEITNVNLIGYIENATRIGRKGFKRPIEVELLSKCMTKYLLENKHLFQNTGLAISECLDDNALQERRKLWDILKTERKKGKYAVIRNNKLFVEGVEFNLQVPEQKKYNEQKIDEPEHNNSKKTQNERTSDNGNKDKHSQEHNFRDEL